MTADNLTVAEHLLSAAHDALKAELQLAESTYALCDAETLTADALSQVRGEMKARLPERPVLDRRAS
jgi:hypothetical protein